jgi:hypothetical protein
LFESGSTEDSPTLNQTLTGLTPGKSYDLYGVFWTDKDENWVAIWGSEIQTDMKGKVDTVSLQETWRFNKAGKVDFMFQAERKGMLPPAPAKK